MSKRTSCGRQQMGDMTVAARECLWAVINAEAGCNWSSGRLRLQQAAQVRHPSSRELALLAAGLAFADETC